MAHSGSMPDLLSSILDGMQAMKEGKTMSEIEQEKRKPEEAKIAKAQPAPKKPKTAKPPSQTRVSTASDAGVEKANSVSAAVAPEKPVEVDPLAERDYILVEQLEECKRCCKRLRKEKVIAVDCEGVNLSRHGRLCLIQISTASEKALLFDLCGKDAAYLAQAGLKDLLEDASVLKILHDCRNDSDALFHQFQVSLKNVFDTQIAFGAVSRQLNAGQTPLPVSLNTLLRKYAFGRDNPYKEVARKHMEEDPNYWEQRPMTEEMVQYARFDVLLLPLVYRQLDAVLSVTSRKVVMNFSQLYLDQYRSLAHRDPSFRKPAASAAAAPPPTVPGAPADRSSATPSPVVPASTPVTAASAPPPAPAAEEREMPKYGIPAWDLSAQSRILAGVARPRPKHAE